MRFLLVEDEVEIADYLQRFLHKEKYTVDLAEDLETAKEALLGNEYPIVILDRILPDGDGVSLVDFARKKGLNTRFLVLSALGDLEKRIEGLEIGADDYIVKPFEPEELLARIRAALRRPLPELKKIWKCGDLSFDQQSRVVLIKETPILLPRRELSILEVLIKSVGRVVTRDILESEIYGYDDEIQSNTIESHMSRLRKHLSKHNPGVKIHAVRGVGYMMKEA